MKRFLRDIGALIISPIILLVIIYLWTDPFRCIHAFDIDDTDVANREYFSTELFLRNQQTYHYNSFIFGSSRGMGLNTYTWKMYLSDDARPFIFQSWGETITGIELKIDYLIEQNIPINNALVLIDIPTTFDAIQLPTIAIKRKHYLFTTKSKFLYNVGQFYNFIQKPSFVVKKLTKTLHGTKNKCEFDTITNDCYLTNKNNYAQLPPQDTISETTRKLFFPQIESGDTIQLRSEPLITPQFQKQLEHIHDVFVNKETDYYVIITPGYCYANPSINEQDLVLLKEIFEDNRIFDYSGKNYITMDFNNYIDPNHFSLHAGFLILQDIYQNHSLVNVIQ